ncbi:polyphosphate polymerase domain-containing protein [Actinotalea sp. C106]|uniref:polyphosphate polymerase domain-containing protein n=1 Tax=Actinotalea sp. C106 TaxID=2908644 RepID=UPI00202870FF|nr:polyphosphate polymerase domain-containing protein [Actinotalea sp. C106]
MQSGLHHVLGALPPVGLEDLLDQAALQRRMDRKYVLPVAAAAELVEGLGSAEDAQVLEIAGRRTFGYSSIYLDTAELDCFIQAARRRPRRFKVRTRTYLDAAECWLEVKTRDRRGWTVKNRTSHALDDRHVLTSGGRAFVRQVLAEAHIEEQDLDLAAALETAYRRSTLYLAASGSRLTVDTSLRCATEHDGTPVEAHLEGHAVVETKTDGRPSAADRLLWSHGYRPVRISKYGTGLAALRPDLPSTPWRPLLKHDLFHPSSPTWSTPATS